MQRLLEYLAMGGYAGFVWPAYAVAAVVLIALLWHSLHHYRRSRRDLALLQRADPRRGAAPGDRR